MWSFMLLAQSGDDPSSILGPLQFHRMHLTEMSENGNMVQPSMA